MSGSETFDRMKAVYPEFRVLLSSGYSLESQASRIMNNGSKGFIQKPFSIHELSIKVKKIIQKNISEKEDEALSPSCQE
jgi:DNA-binding NtrC family response regulator